MRDGATTYRSPASGQATSVYAMRPSGILQRNTSAEADVAAVINTVAAKPAASVEMRIFDIRNLMKSR